eukprot:gene6968-6625_t
MAHVIIRLVEDPDCERSGVVITNRKTLISPADPKQAHAIKSYQFGTPYTAEKHNPHYATQQAIAANIAVNMAAPTSAIVHVSVAPLAGFYPFTPARGAAANGGFNTCLLVHGVPMTGKSHSVWGEHGFAPTLLDALFDAMSEPPQHA